MFSNNDLFRPGRRAWFVLIALFLMVTALLGAQTARRAAAAETDSPNGPTATARPVQGLRARRAEVNDETGIKSRREVRYVTE